MARKELIITLYTEEGNQIASTIFNVDSDTTQGEIESIVAEWKRDVIYGLHTVSLVL